MASNRGVVYVKQGKVEVRSIDFPVMTDSGRPQAAARSYFEDRVDQHLRLRSTYGSGPNHGTGRHVAPTP
jgi:hypothetical protein